ncbi:hypothetical protein CTA1_6684 [Colletotrichum tanaceti]|uniref:Uncharacterized protein n=1 Tax=Colletotrichum tanaceti TaxID=1306861 RepID=A0A4U6XJ76_9PEZI|nr:hypothetical protein CTA1_6684 [Colletotrichum tanaceti]
MRPLLPPLPPPPPPPPTPPVMPRHRIETEADVAAELSHLRKVVYIYANPGIVLCDALPLASPREA